MKFRNGDAVRDLRADLREAEKAVAVALALLAHPEGHPREQLEDRLNEAQDATFRARGKLTALGAE